MYSPAPAWLAVEAQPAMVPIREAANNMLAIRCAIFMVDSFEVKKSALLERCFLAYQLA
jgi:hypothetical protein